MEIKEDAPEIRFKQSFKYGQVGYLEMIHKQITVSSSPPEDVYKNAFILIKIFLSMQA